MTPLTKLLQVISDELLSIQCCRLSRRFCSANRVDERQRIGIKDKDRHRLRTVESWLFVRQFMGELQGKKGMKGMSDFSLIVTDEAFVQRCHTKVK